MHAIRLPAWFMNRMRVRDDVLSIREVGTARTQAFPSPTIAPTTLHAMTSSTIPGIQRQLCVLLLSQNSRASRGIDATARAIMLGTITATPEPNASAATQSNFLSVCSRIIRSLFPQRWCAHDRSDPVAVRRLSRAAKLARPRRPGLPAAHFRLSRPEISIYSALPFGWKAQSLPRSLPLPISFASQPTDWSAGWRANVMIATAFRPQPLAATQ